MKFLFTALVLLITSISLCQGQDHNSNALEDNLKINDFNVSVTVDSAEDIESTFKVKDIENLLNTSANIESMSFQIICNNETMSNGEKSTLSYSVNGDSKNKKEFLKSVRKIRKAAVKYYTNKL